MGATTKEFILDDNREKSSIVCKDCGTTTIHLVICRFIENGEQDCGGGNSVNWTVKNETIQCQGCEEVSFRTISTFSEDCYYDEDGAYLNENIKYYPARTQGLKSINIYLLPESIQQIYKETILSIENEQYVLAGMGIRAIIETICKDLNATGKNLYEKIDFLKEHSIVTQEGSKILHKLRILGNDAAHEVKAHNSQQLELAIQIIEHMIEGTYIIPEKVQKIFPSK